MKTEIENNNEVELTDELIKEIVNNKRWGCEESLIEMRNMGAKWNIKNNSIVLFTEFF